MRQLFNGEQNYSPAVLEVAAKALSAEPFELLIHPERAMAYRRLRDDAVRVVETTNVAEVPGGAIVRTGTDG